jgi:hypothetical protein
MCSQSTLWAFDRINDGDAKRANALQVAPSRAEISRQVVAALRAAVLNGSVRIGFDEFGQSTRVIIQFPVGQQLFDWFFNAHTGYRAQFRIGWEVGLAFNAELVGMLRDELALDLDANIEVRRLNSSFEDIGYESAPRSRILKSLAPRLSKVWFCRKLIGKDGKVQNLLVDISGPRLIFDEYESWAAPYVDESDAWLDLKGAFVAECGSFQIKGPIRRAKGLQQSGSA